MPAREAAGMSDLLMSDADVRVDADPASAGARAPLEMVVMLDGRRA